MLYIQLEKSFHIDLKVWLYFGWDVMVAFLYDFDRFSLSGCDHRVLSVLMKIIFQWRKRLNYLPVLLSAQTCISMQNVAKGPTRFLFLLVLLCFSSKWKSRHVFYTARVIPELLLWSSFAHSDWEWWGWCFKESVISHFDEGLTGQPE